MNLFWTEYRIEQLRKMRQIDMSYAQIAAAIGTTAASARTAWTRHVNGKKPDAETERERSAIRKEQISSWEKSNRDRVNARKRKKRARDAAG